jgi:chitodextrinase
LTLPGTTWSSTATEAAIQNTVADTTAQNDYTDAVRADGATRYWRMGEPSSSRILHDWVGSDDSYGDTMTRGTAGALVGDPNTATTFTGAGTSSAGTRTLLAGPNTFSLEAWFNTTSTTGGKIVGFGNKNVGDSTLYDRHIFMDGTGRITFGVVQGTQETIQTVGSYNNGEWHHVVGNLSPAGLALYVDGVLIGSKPSVTTGHPYSGYWRIGGDPAWGTGSYFAGTIDEVAVYGAPLAEHQVKNHWNLSGRAGIPVGVSDPYGSKIYADSPALYWRLGESTGTTAVDSLTGSNPGTYSGGVTKPAPDALSNTRNTAASFDGTNGVVTSNTVFTNPQVYSLELWFNTTTTTGGKLIGFGDGGRADGTSYSHDRHIYMQNDGKLQYGIYQGGSARTAVTPNAYNDGAWHHVVATQSSSGMVVYVDGNRVASNGSTTPEVFDGRWKVGGDTIGTAWPNVPTTTHITAKIDEVAVYSTALTETQVKVHYAAATGAPVARITSTMSGIDGTFSGASSTDEGGSITQYNWNFGDGGTATGASVTHTFTSGGTKAISLTVVDNTGKTSTSYAWVTATDSVAPSMPGTPTVVGNTGTSISLTWTASTDNAGVTQYEILRAGIPIGTSATTSYTDSNLNTNTPYDYSVRAKDASGNTSAASGTRSVTTLGTNFNAGVFYAVSNQFNGKCLQGGDSGSGDTLRQYTCTGATNQSYQFVQVQGSSGYFAVNSRANTSMAWDVAGSSTLTGARVKMATEHLGLNQQWLPIWQSTHSAYQFKNRNSGMCLQVVPDSNTDGLDLQQAACGATTYQYFNVTAS